MNKESYSVRNASNEDVFKMIEIQMTAMPESLLAQTGRHFLRNALYPIALDNQDTKSYVVETERGVRGFALYGRSPDSFKQQLSRHKLQLLISIFMQREKAPGLLLKCFHSAGKSTSKMQMDSKKSLFHLFLIAVDSLQHRGGLGSKLMNQSLVDAANYFGTNGCLVEARTTNAYKFYKKNGFEDVGYEMRGSVKFYKLYRKVLPLE